MGEPTPQPDPVTPSPAAPPPAPVPTEPRKTPRFQISGFWLGVLIFCATLVAYFPAVTGGYIWDDPAHVTKPELRSLYGLQRIWFDVTATQQYYPVLHSTFWVQHRLWGDASVGYHLLNILLHASVACLVAVSLRRLSIPGAWLAAGIFALHPVHVESVAWITEQKNTLSALFYLSSALLYLHFDRKRQFAFYLLALGLFVLGLLSKTVTATLPAALLVIFWWQRGRLSWKRDVGPLIPWLVLGATAGLFTAWVERNLIGAEGTDFEMSAMGRCLLAGRAIWFYLGKLFWPSNLTFIYPRWEVSAAVAWQYLFPAGIFALVAGLAAITPRCRGPLAGLLFFAGTLFPVLGFFNVYPFIFSFVADHFQYVASLGIIVPVSAGIMQILARVPARARWLSYTLPAVLMTVLGVMSWRQSQVYHDAETLYRTTISRNPACWLAHNNLGFELHTMGRDQESIAHFENALRFQPNHVGAHNNLGVALAAVGRYEEAIVHYEQAVQLRPNYNEAHHNLAVALANIGRAQEALSHYAQALLCAPHYPEVHSDWGFIFGQAGKHMEAIGHCQQALKIRPNNAEAHNYWGIALANAGQIPEAIPHFEQAIRIDPQHLQALNNLGKSFQISGKINEAINAFEQALRIRPDYPEVLYNLGTALYAAGRTQEAIARFEAAVRLEPNAPELHYNLALSLRDVGRIKEAMRHYEQAQRLNPQVPKILWGNERTK